MTNKQPTPPKIGDKIKVICNAHGLNREVIGIYQGDAVDFGGSVYVLIKIARIEYFLKARFWLIELFKGKGEGSCKRTGIEKIFRPSISHWEVLKRCD